ncbi:MAG: methyltransferase [Oscillospiraceae bacterium]|nr:methyltransferase [Oscillospiraceae bacterium]
MNKLFYEDLGDRVYVAVTQEHTFGTDALLLAEFCNAKKSDTVCDLGTGCGVIPLALWQKNRQRIYGVDINPDAIGLFEKGIEMSAGSTDRLTAICADLRQPLLPLTGTVSLVCSNPPYYKTGTGKLSETQTAARHEISCTITDVCKAAKSILKFGGRFCLCHKPERLPEVLAAMMREGIEPKRLRFAAKDADARPWLFLCEGKSGAKPGLITEPLMIVKPGISADDSVVARRK